MCRQVYCPLFETSAAYATDAIENVTFSANGETFAPADGEELLNTQLGWQFGALALVRCKRGFRAAEWSASAPPVSQLSLALADHVMRLCPY
eukprot:2136778-Rhodomonas_salina.5